MKYLRCREIERLNISIAHHVAVNVLIEEFQQQRYAVGKYLHMNFFAILRK